MMTASEAVKTTERKIHRRAMEIWNDEKVGDRIAYLGSRWEDEHEFEDFTDYEKDMKKAIELHGVEFLKGVKRPFGLCFRIKEGPYVADYKLTMSASGDYRLARYSFKVVSSKNN